MSTSPSSGVSPVPGHLRTVTPRLVVRDGPAAIDFYGRAFGAVELGERFTGPDGVDGPVASPERLAGLVSCIMSLYWADVDAAWDRAVGAGAEVMYPLEDQFYGERGGRLRDPFGQQWMLNQHIEDVSAEEIARRAAALYGG